MIKLVPQIVNFKDFKINKCLIMLLEVVFQGEKDSISRYFNKYLEWGVGVGKIYVIMAKIFI
jgi:hypothetical protein